MNFYEKKVSDIQNVSRQGVSAVSLIFEELGFAFREQAIEDCGIDAIVEERTSNSKLSGRLIGVQIKSGPSFFRETKRGKIVFRGKLKHYEYWINYSLPVIIVLYNPETKLCVYDIITSDRIIKTDKSWKIEIDQRNKLENAREVLRNLNKEQSEYQKRLSALAFAKELMKMAEEKKLIVEVREWINKCSGKGDFIIMMEESSGETIELFGKTIYGFGVRPYEEVLPEVFPWADLLLDEEYYAIYGDQEYILNGKQHNSDIYPYCNTEGEVDWYRFRPVLNEVGKSFIMMDTFLREGEMYSLRLGGDEY